MTSTRAQEGAPDGAARGGRRKTGQSVGGLHLTREERAASGKAVRQRVPRSSHDEWTPDPGRPDPVELLEEQAATRVQELVPLRYGRMLRSPFTFFRGAAYLMASDLAGTPRTGLTVQLCGDAHLSNFGSFMSPDRRLLFGLNDFDETLPGPFEWDLKRLVASFAVAGRDRGFDTGKRASINQAVVSGYRLAMLEMAEMRRLDLWYLRLEVDQVAERIRTTMKPAVVKRFERNVAKARAKDSAKAFAKLVEMVDGQPRFVGDPPLIVPLDQLVPDVEHKRLWAVLSQVMRSYRRSLHDDQRHLIGGFQFVEAARKVVGVGSVGTRAWVILMTGNGGVEDPLFLQIKEAQSSVLEPFLGKAKHASHGQRVVEGQRLMQAASDILLGWTRTDGLDGVPRDYYVRQLWDGKGSALIEEMKPEVMRGYADLCGWTLARAHARSGDATAIAGYLGTSDRFDRAMASFAEKYADQNELDYAALKHAAETGRIETEDR
jgi:uncharacterized protein (DUF2252 family)